MSGNQRGNHSLTYVCPCPLPFSLTLLKTSEGGTVLVTKAFSELPCLLGTQLGFVKQNQWIN